MKSNYKRLGDYIRQIDVRNRDLAVKNLLGLSVAKVFMPSIANTIGTDMSNYKIVRQNQFVYIPDTSRRGDKIAIALLDKWNEAIVSAIYTVFEVGDTDSLLPEYLMMWFRRSEFDRYARFKSHGSAREVFEWEEMCDVMLPIPPIEEQQKMVAEYQAVERRIENNRRLIATLESTAQTIYRKMFVDNIDPENLPQGWRMGAIGDFGTVITGKTPSSACPEDFGDDIDFITPGEFKNDDIFYLNPARKLSKVGVNKLKSKLIPQYSLSVTCIGSDMGKVRVCKNECISNQQINSIITHSTHDVPYLFYTLRGMKNELQQLAVGSSTMPMLSKSEFENINMLLPSEKEMEKFYNFATPILDYCFSLENEINALHSVSSILLHKLSK